MAIQSINTIKQWFRTSLKPTQQQFWDWLDSFRHRAEKIGIDDLTSDLANTFFPHSYRRITTATDVAINPEDEYVIKAYDGPASNITFTLPTASSVSPGKVIVVGDENGAFIAAFGIQVAAADGDNINGADVTPVFYAPKFQAQFVSDGVNGWHYDQSTLKLTGAAGNLNMNGHDITANNINAGGSITSPNYYFPGSYAHLTPYGLETTTDWQLANVGGDGGVPAFVYRHSDGRMTFYGPQKLNYHANSDSTRFVKLDADGNITNEQVQYSDIAGTPAAGEDPSLKQNDLTNPDSSHYPTTNAVATALTTKADLVNGKVPLAQINDALIGNVHYKGLYSFGSNAITSDDVTLNGQPLPTAATANAGWYFIAQDTGTVDGTSFILGDWLISNGALGWHKVDNTDAVSSVNGYTGNVSLNKADVGLGNVPNTDATNPANTVQTASYRFVTDAEKATWNSKQAPATTLSGYGITDAVDLYNPQTISGIKTWASGVNSIAIGPNKLYVQITDDIHLNTVSDIRISAYSLILYANNGIISQQTIFFDSYKGISFSNAAGGYTALLSAATPVAAGYTVRLPNASGTIALVGDIPTSAAWSTITGTPTTLAGYGITDAVTLNTAQAITGLKTFTQSGFKMVVGGTDTGTHPSLWVGDGNALASTFTSNPTDLFVMTAQGIAATMALTVADNTLATNRGVMRFSRARGTLSAPSAVVSNDYIGTLLASAYDGANLQAGAGVFFIADADASPGVAPQRISFVTTSTTGAARTEKLQIKSDGTINHLGSIVPALVSTGSANIGSASFRYGTLYVGSVNAIGSASFGVETATTAQLTVLGGSLGTDIITLKRSSGGTVTGQYSWQLAGGGLSFYDNLNSVVAVNILADNSANQIYIGQRGKITLDTRSSYLAATSFSASVGTDVAAQNLVLVGGLGVGTSNPGGIGFQTGNTATSGSAHTATTRMFIFSKTGNITMLGSGTPSDAGYRLDVQGTIRTTSTLTALQHQAVIQAADPTTSNIAAGTYQVYKNSTSGVVKLWYNDGGTLKSVSLT